MRTTLSPSSRGLIPGLFFALAAAFAVLSLNDHWLLPALDDDGVAYLAAAPRMAAGEAPHVPLPAPYADGEAITGLEDRGTAMPLAMAAATRWGARPYVAALWVLGVSAALALLSVAWVAGGVGGIPAALASALALASSPLMVGAVTAIRPEILVMALVGLQLGVMTYRPTWSLGQGLLAAAAWLAHPVGVGAVAAAALWPLRASRGGRAWAGAALAAAPAVALLGLGGVQHGLWVPPGLPGLSQATPGSTAAGVLAWAGAGFAGVPGLLLGLLFLLGALAVVVLDAGDTPAAPPDVHWSHPAAADALTATLRPAAALLALGLATAAAAAASTPGGLAQPWAPLTVPLVALAVSAAVRRIRAGSGAGALLPAAALMAWMSLSSINAISAYRHVRAEGRGHTAAKWVSSEVIRWVDNRSAPYPVLYASDPGLVLLQTGRAAVGIPTGEEKQAAFVAKFRARPGAVVLSGEAAARADALAAELGLAEVVTSPEGRILVPVPAGDDGRP